MKSTSPAHLGILVRAAREICSGGHDGAYVARRDLKRHLIRAYTAWCMEQPGARKDGGITFRRDGMVLRAAPRCLCKAFPCECRS